MGVLLGALLALACLVVVALPLLWRRGEEPPPLAELAERREAVYREIRTLRQEYLVGEVTPQEYEARLRALRLRAAARLRQEEEETRSLEEEVREARRSLSQGRDGHPPRPSAPREA